MKRFTYIIYCLLAACTLTFLLAGCGDNDEALEEALKEPAFLETTSLQFEGSSDVQREISFVAPAPWTIELHHPGSVWLQASRYSGAAGASSIVLTSVADNNGFKARTATLDLFVDGYLPRTIVLKQLPGASYNVSLSGHVTNGQMALQANASGTLFSDTLYVESNTNWELRCDEQSRQVLSFELSEQPLQGVDKKIRVIVSADYSKFPTTSFEGAFSVTCADGSEQKVYVSAAAQTAVYEREQPLAGENPRSNYALVDSIQSSLFATTFYVASNVRWNIHDVPVWLETQADWSGSDAQLTNVDNAGQIATGRQRVALRVNPEMLSVEPRECQLYITDAAERVLGSIQLSFAGLDAQYVDYNLSIPATDAVGNPWMLEANGSTAEKEGAANRKRIELPFELTTAVNYTSIDDAPFHLLLVDATNGRAHRQEMHWLTLRMGDEQHTTDAGLFVKQLYITALERGDVDDKNGVTDASEIRNAFIYIVPKSVTFADLWADEETLKEQYRDDLVLIAQKNDPNAHYYFGLKDVAEGQTLTVKPEGETLTFDVLPGSYAKCEVSIEVQNSDGDWVANADICEMQYTLDEFDAPKSLSFSFKANVPKVNPFTKVETGSDRLIRISVKAFLGEDLGMSTIFTFYVSQKLKTDK